MENKQKKLEIPVPVETMLETVLEQNKIKNVMWIGIGSVIAILAALVLFLLVCLFQT
jgi:hypothetical protein